MQARMWPFVHATNSYSNSGSGIAHHLVARECISRHDWPAHRERTMAKMRTDASILTYQLGTELFHCFIGLAREKKHYCCKRGSRFSWERCKFLGGQKWLLFGRWLKLLFCDVMANATRFRRVSILWFGNGRRRGR